MHSPSASRPPTARRPGISGSSVHSASPDRAARASARAPAAPPSPAVVRSKASSALALRLQLAAPGPDRHPDQAAVGEREHHARRGRRGAPASAAGPSAARVLQHRVQDRARPAAPGAEHERALGQVLDRDRARPGSPGRANALAHVPQRHLDLGVPERRSARRAASAAPRARARARALGHPRQQGPARPPGVAQADDRHRRIAPQLAGSAPISTSGDSSTTSAPLPGQRRRQPRIRHPEAARLRGQQAQPGLGGVANRKRRRPPKLEVVVSHDEVPALRLEQVGAGRAGRAGTRAGACPRPGAGTRTPAASVRAGRATRGRGR